MFNRQNQNEESTWLSLSDMMTVLMLLFLVLVIIVTWDTKKVNNEITGEISEITEAEKQLCKDLKNKIYKKFSNQDLNIDCNPITVTFINPNYQFDKNKSEVKPEFKKALEIFIPVFINTIYDWKNVSLVDEVRVEGHTDSDFSSEKTKLQGFLYNMKLSQERSRNVLDYSMNLGIFRNSTEINEWGYRKMTANGLSFSKRKFIKDSNMEVEDKKNSRRVEFKIRTQTQQLIYNWSYQLGN